MSRRTRSARKARAARRRAQAAARSATKQAMFEPAVSFPSHLYPPPLVGDEVCARLRELAAALDQAKADVDEEVRRLRKLGVGWVPISHALGVSRQGARQRFARR